jgi:hypothetical protein
VQSAGIGTVRRDAAVFNGPRLGRAAGQSDELTFDVDAASQEVDCGHGKSEHFTLPKAGRRGGEHERPVAVSDRVGGGLHLFDGQRDDRLALDLRELDADARRRREESVRHRGCEDGRQVGARLTDRARRELVRESANERLHFRGPDRPESPSAERREDVTP